MTWKKIILLVIGWRIALTLISWWSIQTLTYDPKFPYALALLPQYGSRLLTTWAQFDGVHYLTIIEKGYVGTGLVQAFFPLYPMLVRFLSINLLNPLVIGVVLSTICYIVGLKWLSELINSPRLIVSILLFPTSFFFTSLYTESLFFMLIVGSFLFAQKHHWTLAGILGLLACTSRLVGIFIVPALLYEWWLEPKAQPKNLPWVFLPLLGLVLYMSYLGYEFHDPLLFYHVQSQFNTARESTHLISLPQVVFRYLKMILTVPPAQFLFYTVTSELAITLIGTVSLIYGFFRQRRSYFIFTFFAFLLPTLTGTLSSMPRYGLPLLPLFIPITKFSRPMTFVWLSVSGILLTINLILFTRGWWIA